MAIIILSRALEAADTTLPAREAERERLLLANALANGDAPRGMPAGHRLHPRGTLARLRFERLDDAGAAVDTIEIRAIVPVLPAFGSDAPAAPYGDLRCPRSCREQAGTNDITLLERGGNPGIADEWVLRMPVGQRFDLDRTSLTLQDFGSATSHSLPFGRMAVTLLEVCHGQVRAGAATELEFFPHAMAPIPSGFRTSRWLQLEGCGPMAARPPRLPASAAPGSSEETPPGVAVAADGGKVVAGATTPAARPEVAYAHRGLELLEFQDTRTVKYPAPVVNEEWLAQRSRPQRVRIDRACRLPPGDRRPLDAAGPPARRTRGGPPGRGEAGRRACHARRVPAARGARARLARLGRGGPGAGGPGAPCGHDRRWQDRGLPRSAPARGSPGRSGGVRAGPRWRAFRARARPVRALRTIIRVRARGAAVASRAPLPVATDDR